MSIAFTSHYIDVIFEKINLTILMMICQAYPMNKSCRGIACIINVLNVLGQAPRYGTDVDRDRLTQLFEQLHFRVMVFNDGDGLQAEVSCLPVNCCTNVYDISLVYGRSIYL